MVRRLLENREIYVKIAMVAVFVKPPLPRTVRLYGSVFFGAPGNTLKIPLSGYILTGSAAVFCKRKSGIMGIIAGLVL